MGEDFGCSGSLGEKSITEIINKAKDRNRWKYMTANVSIDMAHDDDDSVYTK
jgi:hypothetical protein